jgi:hypothetical protein
MKRVVDRIAIEISFEEIRLCDFVLKVSHVAVLKRIFHMNKDQASTWMWRQNMVLVF